MKTRKVFTLKQVDSIHFVKRTYSGILPGTSFGWAPGFGMCTLSRRTGWMRLYSLHTSTGKRNALRDRCLLFPRLVCWCALEGNISYCCWCGSSRTYRYLTGKISRTGYHTFRRCICSSLWSHHTRLCWGSCIDQRSSCRISRLDKFFRILCPLKKKIICSNLLLIWF